MTGITLNDFIKRIGVLMIERDRIVHDHLPRCINQKLDIYLGDLPTIVPFEIGVLHKESRLQPGTSEITIKGYYFHVAAAQIYEIDQQIKKEFDLIKSFAASDDTDILIHKLSKSPQK